MDPTKIKPGLYFSGVSKNTTSLGLIYVIRARHEHIPKNSLYGEWNGIIYDYYSFQDEKVYEFNQYLEGFINGLQPVTDESAKMSAKLVITQKFKAYTREGDRYSKYLEAMAEPCGV